MILTIAQKRQMSNSSQINCNMKTIRITSQLYTRLNHESRPNENFNHLISRMLDELNQYRRE
jgi:nickel-dependent lactate racemase